MLEEIQKVLSEYIVRLSERYIYLDTTPNELIVKLFAKPDGKRMYYYLTEIRRYKDGTENEINGEQFLESEREQAIAKFREYQRTHPGIKSEVSI